jgi:hypothetical protein
MPLEADERGQPNPNRTPCRENGKSGLDREPEVHTRLWAGFFPMLSRISHVFAARPVTGTKPEKHFPQSGETCSPGQAKACPTETD